MNMYWHELKSLRKSTILWTCAMISLAALYLSIYPSIASDAADFRKLLSGYPPQIRAMLGISLDSITSLLGFYSMTFSFIALLGAIQAMNLGVSVLSKETREKTADFLLTKHVSRRAIVTSKLLAALTMLIITNIIYDAVAAAFANLVKTEDYRIRLFFMINLTLFFVQLIFFTIGIALSVIIPKLKSVLPVSLGVVFGFFFIGALLASGENDIARFFSPFKYFNSAYIIQNSGYETPYLLTGAIVVILAIAATYMIYAKKDIHAAS